MSAKKKTKKIDEMDIILTEMKQYVEREIGGIWKKVRQDSWYGWIEMKAGKNSVSIVASREKGETFYHFEVSIDQGMIMDSFAYDQCYPTLEKCVQAYFKALLKFEKLFIHDIQKVRKFLSL